MSPRQADPLVARLRRAGCIAADEEARELIAAAGDRGVPEEWLVRRERGEPLAWITGRTRFCGRWLAVQPGVYVPRPQTEELARRAAELLPPGGKAVDLCSGCGAIAAHLQAEVPTATVMGVDRDARAVACARANGVDAVEADVEDELAPAQSLDLVTAVPPYVPTAEWRMLASDVRRYEPRAAIDGGPDGPTPRGGSSARQGDC